MVRSAENAIALQNRRKEVSSFSPCLMSRAKMPYGLATEKLLPRFSKARKVTEQHKAFWGKYGVDTGKPHLSGLGGAGKLSEEKPGQSCRSYLQQILQAVLRSRSARMILSGGSTRLSPSGTNAAKERSQSRNTSTGWNRRSPIAPGKKIEKTPVRPEYIHSGPTGVSLMMA